MDPTTIAIIILAFVIVVLLWVIGDREMKNRKEIEYRDKHLAWVDRRDVLLTELFTKVSEARVVPMTNPLDGMKQHGMITKNAVTPTYLAEMDERLTYTQGFLKRAIAAAKEIERWESQNPAPPVRPGEERAADVSAPMPVVSRDDWAKRPQPSGAAPEAVLHSVRKSTEPIGKGTFGPEVDEPGGAPHGAPQAAEVEPDERPFSERMPKRPIRDNPQA